MEAYSLDLRQRVIILLKKGMHLKVIAEMLEISYRTVARWTKRHLEKGEISIKNNGGRPPKINREDFIEFMENNKSKNLTLDKIAEHFKVSSSTIQRYLYKLGFRYKKKASPTWKPIRKRGKSI